MKKVIMLLSNPCIKDPRVENEAEILSSSGYDVQILAWDRKLEASIKEKRKKFKIIRVRSKSDYARGLIQIFSFFQLYFKFIKYLLWTKDLNIVHCHDLDTLAAGVIVKIFKRIKLVYDAHEIYSDMVFKNFLLNRLCVAFEKFFLKFTDLFITVSNTRKKWYEKNKYSKSPVILGNWKSESSLKLNIKMEKRKLKITDKILILYIGSLNKERMIAELVEAIKNDKRFAFFIAGNGTEKDRILKTIENANNIKYLGYLKNDKEIDYYNKICDVIYYGINSSYTISKTASPNKMFEAISLDKIFYCTRVGEMKIINRINEPFVFIKNFEKDLNKIYKLIFNKNLRKNLSDKNKFLSKLYNYENFKKILLYNYSTLE